MSVAEKMKTLELLSVDRKQFNELIKDRVEQTNQNIDIVYRQGTRLIFCFILMFLMHSN